MTEYHCIACGAPMIQTRQIRPGETEMKCSQSCGGRGMVRVGDDYVAPRTKKPKVKPYWQSDYRGGK